MKKIKLISLIVVLLVSCKYEDGPKFSLRSKAKRAENTWYLNEAFENGVNKTTDYKNVFVNYQIAIKNDNTYEIKYRYAGLVDYIETGKWAFSSDKSTIDFTPETGSSNASKWKILRLMETETWVIQSINGKDVELHMKD